MNLTTQDSKEILNAVQSLAKIQINQNLETYRYDVLNILYEKLSYKSPLFWLVDNQKNLVNPILFNIEESTIQEYLQYFQKHDPLHPKNIKQIQAIQSITDNVSEKEYLNSDYHNLFMTKYNLRDEMAIYIQVNNIYVGVIGLLRENNELKFNLRDYTKLNFLVKMIENGFIFNLQSSALVIPSTPLTNREKEIVIEIAKGKKNHEIAKQLFISENTVKKHLQNLFQKFEVRNRIELLYKLNNQKNPVKK
ncbi:response regulator transcription factor [Lysinibacillus sp. NPDC048646]|uniref:response regulator transcription factor n=1 Tax=Lysinibacillus sp. NPDC048646 TaxID=3390574 RepID=UPI003D06970A